MADSHRLQRVAIHEAGHAVVAHVLGFTVTAIDLWAEDLGDAQFFTGCTHLDDGGQAETVMTRDGVLDTIAVLVAGHAANSVGGAAASPIFEGLHVIEGRDAEALEKLLSLLGVPPKRRHREVRRQWQRACSIIGNAWPSVSNIATAVYNAYIDATGGEVVVARVEIPVARFAEALKGA